MPETGFQIENSMKAPSSCFWSETHLVIWTRAGWHLSRLRPVGLALRALCSSLDGCTLPGLHSLRSSFDGCALPGLHSLRSSLDGCALSGLHSLRSWEP